MSLVGTRPPTVDEWEQYELHHRSRMSIKPGITGMWQASGRSDITDFEEVVKLDTEYIENWTIGLDKWFEFGKDEQGNDLPKTVISREFSSEWKPGDEPYYPVNDEKNGVLYAEYKKLADAEEKVIFGGRLGEYKYYDMDAVIASALDMCERELQ